MSETEQFYNAIAAKMQVTRPFSQLHPVEVQQLIQAINMILGVMRNG